MKRFFIFILLFLMASIDVAHTEEVVLDSFIIENLQKNSSDSETYDFAHKIFSEKKVTISETHEEIGFKAKAIKEIFDLEDMYPERGYRLLNCLIQNDLYKTQDAKDLLNNTIKTYTFDFPYQVLEKNPKVQLKDINTYIESFNFDEPISQDSLKLIIKDDSLVFVYDVFCDEGITKMSKLNAYAPKRLKYNTTTTIDDELLKEFLEYGKQDSKKAQMVELALVENDIKTYDMILSDIQSAKLKKIKMEQKQKRKEDWQYCKKCFLSTDEHLANFSQYHRRSNPAFLVGMLNPINFVSTVFYLPIYIILSPLGGLP